MPATSANLGCAFDCAALALDLHLRVVAHAQPEPGITMVREDGSSAPVDPSDLIARAILVMAARGSGKAPGVRLEITSDIPIGVGLGSSAAAIVAGLQIGAHLGGVAPSDDELLSVACEIEGHPDNVSAAYLGGLVVAGRAAPLILWRRAEIPSDLHFVVAIPELPMPTSEARAVLPRLVDREDSVHNLQRVALLVASAFSGNFDLGPELFEDRLHQPYRQGMVPGIADCLLLRHPDLLGVYLSGAGSSVLAIARRSAAEIGDLLRARFESAGTASRTLILAGDNRGARGRMDLGEPT